MMSNDLQNVIVSLILPQWEESILLSISRKSKTYILKICEIPHDIESYDFKEIQQDINFDEVILSMINKEYDEIKIILQNTVDLLVNNFVEMLEETDLLKDLLIYPTYIKLCYYKLKTKNIS